MMASTASSRCSTGVRAVLIHQARPRMQQQRSFAGGGYHGPNSRGTGRDGGGRGLGGPHRAPTGRGGGGRAGRGGEGGGAFSAFRARRDAALERDLEDARRRTAAEAGGRADGFGGRGGRGGRGRAAHPATGRGRGGGPGSGPGEGGRDGQRGRGTYHRPSRAPHRGGPPKPNFDDTVLRPASEGHLNPNAPSKHDSGIPKLAARKPIGHQVHDEGGLASARPAGQRRSGRAAVRGEMSNRVVGDLEAEGAEDAPPAAAGGDVSSLKAMMLNVEQGRGGASSAPVHERVAPSHNRRRGMRVLRGGGGGGGGYDSDDDGYDSDDESRKVADQLQEHHLKLSLVSHFNASDNQDDDGYDSDADLEPIVRPGDPDYMDLDNHEHVRKSDAGDYAFDWGAMDEVAVREAKEVGNHGPGGEEGSWEFDDMKGKRGGAGGMNDMDVDPATRSFEYDYYFRDITDLDNQYLLKPSKPDSNAILPLKPHGSDIDDFLYATMDHPSKYAQIERKARHPDSSREPRPTFPRERKLPDKQFVEKYKGYLFVSGLVPINGFGPDDEDLNDVMHKQSISEKVAKLFKVNPLDVWPATSTSAFVGFGTKLKAKAAMIDSTGDDQLRVSHPVALQKYEDVAEGGKTTTEGEEEFVAASPGGPSSILKVTGLPVNATSVELLQSMFPPGSRLEAMFGLLSKDDYFRASSTSALINLASADLVSKAIKSTNVANNASALGRRSVQVLRAKRERVFDGWQGVHRSYAASRLGDRLIVTGDVPPIEMYLSHHDTLHVSGLPPHVTLADLASFFQPYSADRRDTLGSGHIVRCSRGLPTGSAYVGFELPGEIDRVREAFASGRATIGGAEVRFHAVRDKLIRRGVREGARPARSVEELRADLLDWERHVDPEEVRELERLGVDRGVLDEVMMTLRHRNRTFAAADQAISGERLYQERQVGTHYRDAVRRYLKTLKECVGTREDPGLMYWAMFYPDQEMDMGLFDSEEERIKELRKKGI